MGLGQGSEEAKEGVSSSVHPEVCQFVIQIRSHVQGPVRRGAVLLKQLSSLIALIFINLDISILKISQVRDLNDINALWSEQVDFIAMHHEQLLVPKFKAKSTTF